MVQRVLITGADGQLGQAFRWLADYAASLGIELIFTDRPSLDLCNPSSIESALTDQKPHVVVNAAAYTAVDKAESDFINAETINVLGAQMLAEACARHKVWIIQLSTDYVFDGALQRAYTEVDQANPQGVYGRTKLAGELAVGTAATNSIILRTSWVFSQFGQNFLNTMVHLGTQRDRLGIVADQTGTPTYAPHIAHAILQLIQARAQGREIPAGVYHFSGAPNGNWYEFACYIFSLIHQLDPSYPIPVIEPISTKDYPTAATRPANSALSSDKIMALIPGLQRNWQHGVELALQVLLKQHHVQPPF